MLKVFASVLGRYRSVLATVGLFSLISTASTARAEQRTIPTLHVPEAVSTGVAPLVGRVPATQRLSLAISLPLRSEGELDQLLQEVYDPQSPSYRHYLTTEEFTSRFGPSSSDYEALQNFAQTNNLRVVEVAANRMLLDVEGASEDVENAFHIQLNVYQHPTEARTFYAPDREPSVDLDVPLLHVTGLDNYTLPQAKNVRSGSLPPSAGTGSGPNGDFIGSDMRAAYYGSGSLNGAGQTVGLFEFAGYNLADVTSYFSAVKQPLEVPVKGVSLNGASLQCKWPKCDDSEQALDIEMAISMAPGLTQVIVYVGNDDVSIFNRMASDNIAKQLSCSWGWKDDESSLDPIFKEMATQGQSVFVATGDSGSGTPGAVVWPSDDPYVTAVGGTDLATKSAGGPWAFEAGWSGSAGMPSKNGVPIPSYQLLPGVINSSNDGSTKLRNIPDVSAEANTNQFSCFDNACYTGNGGTSYAAPQWAAFIAMANQKAVGSGKAILGFLNPSIYNIGVGTGYRSDFHDIVSGNNGGYNAVAGYDLVTGWGSPAGPNLMNALISPDGQ
jgi:subtilase family serine protease